MHNVPPHCFDAGSYSTESNCMLFFSFSISCPFVLAIHGIWDQRTSHGARLSTNMIFEIRDAQSKALATSNRLCFRSAGPGNWVRELGSALDDLDARRGV